MLGREWVLPGCGGLADRQKFNLERKFSRIQSRAILGLARQDFLTVAWAATATGPAVGGQSVSQRAGGPRTDRRRARLDDGTEDGAADPRKGTVWKAGGRSEDRWATDDLVVEQF